MTYSGVGKVVPSMVAANRNASSQNATWRGTASLARLAAGEWPRQSIQAESDIQLGACGVAMVIGRSRRGCATVGLMWVPVPLRLHRAAASLTPGRVSGRHTAG